jgi:hypothetical protein
MENTHNGEKRRLKLSTSQLIVVQHEKNCRSFLSLMDGLYQAKNHFTLLPL